MRIHRVNKVLVSGAAAVIAVGCSAQDAQASESLNLKLALDMSQACVAAHTDQEWPPMAIAIYNNNGRLVSFQIMDGAMTGAIELALGKAKTSASFPFSTMDIANLVAADKGAKGLADFPGVVTVQGGIPIILEGTHIGGIGVSGGMPKQDEDCAKVSLKVLEK